MDIDFASYSLGLNLAIFAVCAALLWWAGSRLVVNAEALADRFDISRGVAGLLMLATVTSLPELATTVSAARIGAAELATSNLLGGVSMQTAVLAVVDGLAIRGALTAFAPSAALLLQGVVLILLLGTALGGALTSAPKVGHISASSIAILGAFVVGFLAARQYERHPAWVPRERRRVESDEADGGSKQPPSAAQAGTWFAICALVIFATGWTIVGVAHALADQTGLGGSFVGATLVAISTSLPEVTTTLAAARQRAYAMAISNVFGSNCLCVALLVVADVVYTGGPVFKADDHSAMFAGMLGIVLTTIYLWGLLERRDRTIFRMGWDSCAVLIVYGLGIAVLYFMD